MTIQTGSSGGLTDQVRERAAETVDEARSRGREAVEGQVDSRSTQAGESLGQVADQARTFSNNLREQGNDTAAQLVDQAARYTERAADYLRQSSASTILDDVEGYARRQPWAIALGGALLGFAAARVLRASRSNDGDRIRDHRYDVGYSTPRSGSGVGSGYALSGYDEPRSTATGTYLTDTTGGYASGEPIGYSTDRPEDEPTGAPGTTSEGYQRGGI
jgi:vacuolar-type H+-ATPase subunit H